MAANPGEERVASTRLGNQILCPDLILTSTEGRRRLHAVVEVETSESVNHLEAMAQWAHLARVRGAFYLYVPVGLADVARRLCEGNKINVTEIWTYYIIGSQVRFTMSYRSDRAKLATKAPVQRKKGKSAKTSLKTKKKSKASKTKKKSKASKTKKKSKASFKRKK